MNEDVLTLGVLVALDDLVVGDLGKGLALPHTFDVADRFTGRGMDHAKGNPALARGRMQLDRDQHEGQAEIAGPEGRRHDAELDITRGVRIWCSLPPAQDEQKETHACFGGRRGIRLRQ